MRLTSICLSSHALNVFHFHYCKTKVPARDCILKYGLYRFVLSRPCNGNQPHRRLKKHQRVHFVTIFTSTHPFYQIWMNIAFKSFSSIRWSYKRNPSSMKDQQMTVTKKDNILSRVVSNLPVTCWPLFRVTDGSGWGWGIIFQHLLCSFYCFKR